MNKNKNLLIFFGDKGLTSTSANHIANIAKECYQQIEEQISSIKFYDTYIKLLNNDTLTQTQIGSTQKDLDTYTERVLKIAQLKSLIAWLREAIQAKEILDTNLKNFLSESSIDEICEELGLKEPILNEYTNDIKKPIDKFDYIGEHFDLKKRNTYYNLETLCSTIGEIIHPNGAFANARKEFIKVLNNPISAVVNPNNGSGDSYVYTYKPTVDASNVEDKFFELQNLQREYQKEFNSLKYEIEQAVKDDEIRYNKEKKIALDNYSVDLKKFNAAVQEYIAKKRNEISNYKIIIPDKLKDVYEYVSNIGKKKKSE